MERFAKIVNGFQSLTIFTKCFILDISQSSKYIYAPVLIQYNKLKKALWQLSIITVHQDDVNQLRISLLENLGQSSEVMPILNKLQFGQMSFLYSVYQLERLRLNCVTAVLTENMFSYLEDRAVQKDKTGTFLRHFLILLRAFLDSRASGSDMNLVLFVYLFVFCPSVLNARSQKEHISFFLIFCIKLQNHEVKKSDEA